MKKRLSAAYPSVLLSLSILVATWITGFVMAAPDTVHAAGKTVWDGVYTLAQAERGMKSYDSNCRRCHSAGSEAINPESRLRGNGFMERWREDDLEGLFSWIRTTMPRLDPGSLSANTYVDILSYLLQVNGFPVGSEELSVDGLEGIRIEEKEGPQPLPSGALVQMVACFSEEVTQDHAAWILTSASEPSRTRKSNESTAAEKEGAKATPLGHQTFKLQNLDYLADSHHLSLDSFIGHKILAKGYVIRQPSSQRLDITLLEMFESNCAQ
jgi:hypothetical protein